MDVQKHLQMGARKVAERSGKRKHIVITITIKPSHHHTITHIIIIIISVIVIIIVVIIIISVSVIVLIVIFCSRSLRRSQRPGARPSRRLPPGLLIKAVGQ